MVVVKNNGLVRGITGIVGHKSFKKDKATSRDLFLAWSNGSHL
jgi:hypothetical protein